MAKKSIRSRFRGAKSSSSLLVLYIPSVDRNDVAVDQERWVEEALTMLGAHFGGATAFPRARGVWRDDSNNRRLIFDQPVIVQCYTSEESLDDHGEVLHGFLQRMGTETNQAAVGFVIDRDYLEISFPTAGRKHGKKRPEDRT